MADGRDTYCYSYSCPDDHRFIETSSSKWCQATCSSKTYEVDGSKRICVSTCADHYYQESSVSVGGVSQTYFWCTDACEDDNDYKVVDGKDTYCYNYQCPDDHRFIETSNSKTCKDICASETYRVDGSKKICTTSCGEFYQEDTFYADGYWQTHLRCADSCDSNIYKEENGRKICADACSNFYQNETVFVDGWE